MRDQKRTIIIATTRSWNIRMARDFATRVRTQWNVRVVNNPDALSRLLRRIQPAYLFFPHWSWIIPSSIHSKFPCIAFHMTDLPYGRGGSPMQNLILRKRYATVVSAFRVTEKIDAGPVYLKQPLRLSTGNARQMLERASRIIFMRMIPRILQGDLAPAPQTGRVVAFRRRGPEQSDLSRARLKTIRDLYDFIRMLDGEGYPAAFLKLDRWTIRFSDARLHGGAVKGRFTITDEARESSRCRSTS